MVGPNLAVKDLLKYVSLCDKSRWFTQFQHSLILSILLSLQALDLQFQ